MKRFELLIGAVLLLFVPRFTIGGDVDDLKAAHEQLSKAFMSMDAAGIASMIMPGAVNFESVFPQIAPMENTETLLINHYKVIPGPLEYLVLIPYNVQYKVVGDTGIVWGHVTEYVKSKGGTAQIRYLRMSSTWVKSDGKWKLLLAHSSAIPSGE